MLSMVLVVLLVGFSGAARAAAPVLEEVQNAPLLDTYRTGKPYTISLSYRDADGDRPRKAQFVDRSDDGTATKDFSRIVGSDFRSGVVIEWDVNGLARGAHNAFFVVTDAEGKTTRFQRSADPNGFYSFVVEDLITKLAVFGVGLLVGLAGIPFLVYVLARAMNKRGDPSRAARVGLLLGILACTALGIYLFLSFYGPLTIAIGAVAGLALLVLVFTRR